MSAQVAADLRAAAELLRRDGWCRYVWREDTGERCLGTAAADALIARMPYLADTPDDERFDRDFIAVMKAWKAWSGESMIGFNDAPGRTADEVIAALEAAADAAEATP